MSRPRGPHRYDRPEDREEIKAICLAARDRLRAVLQRVSFSAPHHRPTVEVATELQRIAEMLGHPRPKIHSIQCGKPPLGED